MSHSFAVGSWPEAEQNAAIWLREWGFSDAKVTPPGADGGLDVKSRGAVAQVKYKAAATGRPDVQRLVGARPAEAVLLFFFSSGGYTQHAIDYSNELGVNLFTYGPDGSVASSNRSADAFLDNLEKARESERMKRSRAFADATMPPQIAAFVSTRGIGRIRRAVGLILALVCLLCVASAAINGVLYARGSASSSVQWWDFPILVTIAVLSALLASRVMPDDE